MTLTQLQKEWADPELGESFTPQWNSLDNSINRASHEVKLNLGINHLLSKSKRFMHASQGPYQVEGGRPLNIRGRTGLAGRGVLGKYVQDIAHLHI